MHCHETLSTLECNATKLCSWIILVYCKQLKYTGKPQNWLQFIAILTIQWSIMQTAGVKQEGVGCQRFGATDCGSNVEAELEFF